MTAKFFLVICAQTVLIQAVFSQVIASSLDNISIGSGTSGFGLSGSGYGGSILNGSGLSGLTSKTVSAKSLSSSSAAVNSQTGLNVASGGPLVVTSISPIGPSGLAVASEQGLEGVLTVSGQLPFLSAVAFEGSLPTAGSGVATCGCGTGEVGIVSEGLTGTPAASNSLSAGRRF